MTVDISVDAHDALNMIAAYQDSVLSVESKLLIKAANMYVDMVRNDIQTRGSVVSANLHASTRILQVGDGFIIAGSDLPYAVFFEYGRGPVVPVSAKVLHFITKDGREVFTKYVGPAAGAFVFEAAAVKIQKAFEDMTVEMLQ